jgi:hypothetical protein
MRTGITITVSASDRLRLEMIANDRNAPQKHVWRSRIILLSADGLGTSAIMRAAGKSKTCVWRWQERFCGEGVDGLLRDKTRPPGIAPVAASLVEKVVALTLKPPPHEATHWTAQAMAKAAGLAVSTVQCWIGDVEAVFGKAPRWRHPLDTWTSGALTQVAGRFGASVWIGVG